ncbi:DUF2927 domain-containing protein [Primorskyibacter flagellatus]|uniref:ATP-dependent transcriptional regulator n=1 Tax=Primorskyibacter flagellatus TaxID=1387277 RepID=A0A1W1YY95_9RHOB|nr:DUF2927 domain-containing protein [Primorskyibacter flagellatus]SMC41169.1 Protein of unknown function [Primorskyibacter flagellatus]
MRRALLPVLIVLSGCVPLPGDMPANAAVQSVAFPSMTHFITKPRMLPPLSNADVARDFLDLSFQLESGRALPVLTRFEGPIRVRITGAPSASLGGDLGRLLHRLRSEAGLDISTTHRSSAEITIQAVPRDEIQRALPKAACFVAPNVTSLAQYRRMKHSTRINWSRLKRRDRLAIFIPNDVSPQEIRDCLHEELAQAIGPLNDLYRLPDSVFNDDNVHTILTAHDMLILRTYYHSSLHSGMTREEVAVMLPGILAKLNPQGETRAPRHLAATPRNWISAIETALGPGASPNERRDAGTQAVKIAGDLHWTDHRRAFSHFAMGRLLLDADADSALEQFKLADRYYARTPQTALHRAYIAAQLAAHAISQADGKGALTLLSPHFDAAARHENAALLSTLMLLRVEALDLEGRTAEAQAERLDSLGWARYGFGEDWAVRAKMYEIGALNPLKNNTGGS